MTDRRSGGRGLRANNGAFACFDFVEAASTAFGNALWNTYPLLINVAAGLNRSQGYVPGALGVIEKHLPYWDGSTSRLNLQEENL